MEGSLWIAVAALAAIAVVMWMRNQEGGRAKDGREWPPGPLKLPFIGNLYELGREGSCVHKTLTKLAKIHGKVMTIWIGSKTPVIVVTDRDLAWEVLVTKSSDYASRHISPLSRYINANFHTVATSDYGSHWNSLRKGLTNGAFAPLSLSSQTQFQESDITYMIKGMKNEASINGGVIEPFPHLRRTTIRLLARLIFGSEFNNESFVHKIDECVEEVVNLSGHTRIVDAFPDFILKFIPKIKTTIHKTKDAREKVEQTVRPHLTSSFSTNSYAHFLLSQNLPEEITIFTIFEIFLLGVDSTASTTTWALAFLIREQKAQQKLYEELQNNVGKEEIVKVEKVYQLPYLQAVVKETMRMKPIAPLAVTHKATKDTRLMGYKVAEGTPVMVNLFAIHYDPKVWTLPESFMPERFLPASMNDYQQSSVPFGAGMRVCAGMEVGRLQISLALANLVHAFQWVPAVDGNLPDLTEYLTFVLMKKNPLTAQIVPRAAHV